MNGIFLSLPGGSPVLDPQTTLRFIVGDMLGLVATIFLIALIRSYVRKFMKANDTTK